MKNKKIIYLIFILIFVVSTLSFINSTEGIYTGTSIDVSSIGSGQFSSIITNNTFIWGYDTTFDRVYKLFQNGTSTGTYFSATGVSGLTTNNTFIWVVTGGTSTYRVYKYLMDGTNTTEYFTITLSSVPIKSITNDNFYFYVLYGTYGNSVRAYWMNGTYTGSNFVITGQIPTGTDVGSGITTSGGYIWVTGKTSQSVYKYSIDMNSPDMSYTGTSWNTSLSGSGNTAPTSITMNSTTFFVRDNVNQLIYEYYVNYVDTTPPYFTTIPANVSVIYGNSWNGVYFNSTDNYGFGYYKINDTRFSINQTGFLTNTTPMAVGNYEINVTINDTSNNINWTRYKVQINKSNYYDCSVYFNTTSPQVYPNNFIVYTNCSSAYMLYKNGTYIANASTISGAGYYNLTVQRNDTANYTNTVDSQFFTINKVAVTPYLKLNDVASDLTVTYPAQVNASASCDYGSVSSLTRNSTDVTAQNNVNVTLGSNYYLYEITCSGDANHSQASLDRYVTINKATMTGALTSTKGWNYNYDALSTTIGFSESNVGDSDVTYEIYRDGVNKSLGETVNLPTGTYAYILNSTGGSNYSANTLIYSNNLIINKNPENCQVKYNSSSPITYPATFLAYANCTTPFTLMRNGTAIGNNSVINSGAGAYNISFLRTDTQNYSNIYNESQFIVSKATTSLTASGTSPINYGTAGNVAGSGCPSQLSSDCKLYRNGTQVSTPDTSVLGANFYNYIYNTSGNANYTADSDTFSLTVNKISPSSNMQITGTTPIIYLTTSDFSPSETNTGDSGCSYSMDKSNGIYGVGTWTFNYSTSGCSNYTSGYVTKDLVVNKNPENCQVKYNSSSPITYPATFLAYANCTTPFTLMRNGTAIGNNSVINSGAGAYNISFLRTDTQNYSIIYNESQFIVSKSLDSCSVYFNATSPITHPATFIAYTNCTSSYALTKNGTSISNGSVINSGATAYSIIVQRADTANYTNIVDSQQFIISKNDEKFNVLFNTSSPLIWPDNFLVWANVTSPFVLTRNGTTIGNNSVQNSGAGYFNFTAQRNDMANYTNNFNTSFFTINKVAVIPKLKLNDAEADLTVTYLLQANASASCDYGAVSTLTRNATNVLSENNIYITLGANYYLYEVTCSGDTNHSAASLDRYITVNKNPENFQILYNTTSPLEFPNTFLVWANSTTAFTLKRNNTVISNASEQRLAVKAYNFSAQRTDTQNYSITYNQSQFIMSPGLSVCGVYFNTTSPSTFPDIFIVYSNCSSAYNLYRNGSAINNNTLQISGSGYFNYTVQRTDTANYTSTVMTNLFTVNKNLETCQIFFNETSPLEYTNDFEVWSNCSTAVVLKRNTTVIVNNSVQSLGISAYNFSFSRNDTQNYSYIFNQSQFIVTDTISPVLAITQPNNGDSFTTSSTFLNYTIYDAGIGLDMCWYQNNTGNNITIACGANTSISQGIDGDYTIYMFANDTFGNLATDSHLWTISSNAPAVTLINPAIDKYFNTGNYTNFNFTSADGNGISFAKLYTNSTGNWDNNDTLDSVVSGVETNFKLLNFTDGYYQWNVWSNDSTGLPNTDNWATLNRTFTIDTIYPSVNITNINPTIGSQFIFSTNISDVNLLSCNYAIFNSTGYIDASASAQGSFTCNVDQPAGTIDYGTYNLTVYATDKAGNQQYTWVQYIISPTAPIIISGGGGGAAPSIRSWYMSTEAGVLQESTQTKTFQLSMLAGGSRDKYIYFYNNGTANRTISLTCTGSICDNVFFSATKITLAAGINNINNVQISVILPEDTAKGDYSFNIIGTDENSLSDIITVTVSVGAFGVFTEFINKITTNATIFGLQVPYILILILIIVVLSCLLYLILRRKSWGLQTAIIGGILLGLIIVYFL